MPTGDRKMLDTILNKWSAELGELPRDYITYDIETTGVDPNVDLIVEIGYCAAIDCRAEEYHTHVLDWTQVPTVDQHWLRHRLDACAKHFKKAGRTYHMSFERMRKEGSHPEVVLEEYRQLFDEARQSNIMIAGHNAVQFDNDFFEQAVYEWLQRDDWTFPSLVFDTAAVLKATQLDMPPHPEESLHDYFVRVLERPATGIAYNLDSFCVEHFDLKSKFPDIDFSSAHSAGFDAMVTHLILEEFR